MVQRCQRMCEGCGGLGRDVHHRQPRGMGGILGLAALAAHSPANLMYLCGECHDFTLDEPEQSRKLGWIVPHGVADPREIPARMVTVNGTGWYLLLEDATYQWVDEDVALDVMRVYGLA